MPTRGPMRTLLSASVSPPTIQPVVFVNWIQPAPRLLAANTLAPVDLPLRSTDGYDGLVPAERGFWPMGWRMFERNRLRWIETVAAPSESRLTVLLESKVESSSVMAPEVVTSNDGVLPGFGPPRSKASTNFSVSGPLALASEPMLWPWPL